MKPDERNPLMQVPEQVGELAGNLTKLFRLEVQLAKTEVKQSVKSSLEKSGLLLFGSALLMAALLASVGALVVGLANVMPLWASFLTTSALLGLIGGGTIQYCLTKMKAQPVAPKFKKTMINNKDRLLEAV